VVGYGPFSLGVIHKEGVCPGSEGIHRLMLMMTLPLRGTPFQLKKKEWNKEELEDIKENSWLELNSIPETTFKKCFDDWIIRWRKYIDSEAAYFENDKINLNE
jgi:hypothetical protein